MTQTGHADIADETVLHDDHGWALEKVGRQLVGDAENVVVLVIEPGDGRTRLRVYRDFTSDYPLDSIFRGLGRRIAERLRLERAQ